MNKATLMSYSIRDWEKERFHSYNENKLPEVHVETMEQYVRLYIDLVDGGRDTRPCLTGNGFSADGKFYYVHYIHA